MKINAFRFADYKIIPIFAIGYNSEYITPSDIG